MTSPRSQRSFACRLLPPGLLALAAALAALPAPAAPTPTPRAPDPVWPKTSRTDRARSANNLKQIALTFHLYHDVYGHLPSAAIQGKDGKPLLSWRVAILPFIEETPLYMEFKLDEPWDSPSNKKLLAKMPKIYGLPGVKVKPDHGTFYRVFTGPDAPFKLPAVRPLGLRLTDFTDGTSNTLLVAEAGEAVPWTKPDELAYAAKKPVPKLGGLFPEGFHVAMCDGSVRYIGRKIPEDVLRALITPAGGEVIDNEKIPKAQLPAEKK